MRLFTQQRRVLLLLAVGFLAGCGGDENPANGGGGGNNVIGNNNCTSGVTCKQVTIGTQVWMGENLNYATLSGSWCYDDDNSNCVKYGRLYDWEVATTVCPSGWHLPSRVEWGELAKAAGGTGTYGDGGTAGTKLKSKTGWGTSGRKSGNGTDDFGFSALPGGARGTDGSFYDVGNYGNWWTVTENGGDKAYNRKMNYNSDNVNEYGRDVSGGLSVRCLRD